MKSPNLFKFATSELSQDAFICWLLSWASPEYSGSSLHRCGIELIGRLFEKHGKELPTEIDKVEVIKQDSNIDVLCIVNEKYAILIEDKTGTKNHSGQLSRYLNEIRSRDFADCNILPIYFKTRDQACYAGVEENGYHVFSRNEFLSVLNFGVELGINSDIFNDFRNHLKDISDKVNSYRTLPIDQWYWRHSWEGFYMELKDKLGEGHWDHVSNPAGGFLGFWWHFQGDSTCKQYLQLEESKFCIKIKVNNSEKRKDLRSKWHRKIVDNSEKYGLNLRKPDKFGNGNYMTVLVASDEYRQVGSDGCIDMQSTVEHLKKAENLLKYVRETT